MKHKVPVITRVKGILGGKPIIEGHRISVDLVISYVVNDLGVKDIKQDYPHLTDQEIMAALEFGAQRIQSVKTSLDPQAS